MGAVYSGILGKNIASLQKKRFRYPDKFAQIIELYDKTDNQTTMAWSSQNLGVASFLSLITSKFKSSQMDSKQWFIE
jgi:hypothetical protein